MTAAPDHDPARRAFFRSFGRQAFTTAAQVVGMADAISKATTSAAVNVVGLVADPEATVERLGLVERSNPQRLGQREPAPSGSAAHPSTVAPGARPEPVTTVGYRSPYRLDGDVLYLLDQRALPDRLQEQACRRGSDVAFYMRVMAVRGGPLMAQLAAYGLALTAREFAARSRFARDAEWKRVCRALIAARGGSRMVRFAIERMTALHEAFPEDADGLRIAAALREEADGLAAEAQLDHARIARSTAALLPRPQGRPLQVLVHGVPGSSTCGHLGTALNALSLLAGEGLPVKAWLTETRPDLEGVRLAAWELGPTGVQAVLLPDGAVGHLLDRETVDAVLLGAEWIAANGDTSNVVGSSVAATMAGMARGGPVPVYVTAPATTIDPETPDGGAIPLEVRPGREMAQHLAGLRLDRFDAFLPALDVIPGARITAFVTEMGVLEPAREALVTAHAERQALRAPVTP